MQKLWDDYGYIVKAFLLGLLIACMVVLFVTNKKQETNLNEIRAQLEQIEKVNVQQITMQQVESKIDAKIEKSVQSVSSSLSEEQKKQLDTRLQKALADSEEKITASLYEKLKSDLEREKAEKEAETKKKSTGSVKKKSQKATVQETSTPAQMPALPPAENEEEDVFVIEDEESIID